MNVKKRSILIAVILVLAVIATPGYREVLSTVSKMTNVHTVVIDPGHGGIDGGAQSSDGMSEKDINLSISSQLKKRLENDNIKVIMTRSKDEGLYDESQEGAIRSLKTADMKARKLIIDESDCELAVSIHLNSFTQDSSVKGAQVFYPSYGDETIGKKSERAAGKIQSGLNKTVNIDKPRTELAKNDVYLLKDVTCPTVIVECGFLSNPDDAENLRTKNYQKKIVNSLENSICEYLKVKRL